MAEEHGYLGLFPLGLVLLPGETIPLHIFEDRYKRLIGERRDTAEEFGIVYIDEDKLSVTGCSAVVTAVIEEMDDGRMNILVEGRRRFRIDGLDEPDDPESDYLRAEVDFFADDETGSERARASAGEAFIELLEAMGVPGAELPEGEAPLSFRLAGSVDFGADIKQTLLESRSETERLTDLAAAFHALVPQAEAQRKRAEAIRGNGKGA
jgi:ATP-dependent Lon protease